MTPQNTPQRPWSVEASSSQYDAASVLIRSALKQRCFKQWLIPSVFWGCFIISQFLKLMFSILNESAETEWCSPVWTCSQARKIKFLLSSLSSCEQSLWFMPVSICDVWSANALVCIHLFCLLVLMIYVPINNLGHVGEISCLLVLNHCQATDKVPCPRTQHCDSGESRPPNKSLY